MLHEVFYNCLFYIIVTMTTLSIFGAVGIIACYVKFTEERNMIRHLLVALTIADCFVCMSNIMSMVDGNLTPWNRNESWTPSKNACFAEHLQPLYIAEVFISTCGSLASITYNIAIAAYFYIVATKSYETVNRINLSWIHAICCTVSIGVVIVAQIVSSLSNSFFLVQSWCMYEYSTLVDVRAQIIWNFLSGRGWEMLAYVITPLFYYIGYYELRKTHTRPFSYPMYEQRRKQKMWFREEDRNFLYVPPLFYILRIWGTVICIVFNVQLGSNMWIDIPDTVTIFFLMMTSIGDNAQAFCNFIIFCILDKTIRRKLIRMFRDCRSNPEMKPILDKLISPPVIRVNDG